MLVTGTTSGMWVRLSVRLTCADFGIGAIVACVLSQGAGKGFESLRFCAAQVEFADGAYWNAVFENGISFSRRRESRRLSGWDDSVMVYGRWC